MKAVEKFNNSMRGKKPAKCKVIVSSHNYQYTPSIEDLGNLVAAIQASGADIVKIATTAVEITDVARVFQITVHSQVSGVSRMSNLSWDKNTNLSSYFDFSNYFYVTHSRLTYSIHGDMLSIEIKACKSFLTFDKGTSFKHAT